MEHVHQNSKKIPHNKPDLLVWDTDQKICQIIEFSCPYDVNLIDKASNKKSTSMAH